MKLQVFAVVGLAAVALAAGPAAGQGTFNPGAHRSPAAPSSGFGPPPGYGPPSGYGAPHHYGALQDDDAAPANPHRARAGVPEEPKPYKPFDPSKYGSSYATPPAAPHGAKDCELSVYVNACARHR